MNSNISVTFAEAKEKCLITYDQRLVFSRADMQRLLEFALGVEGGPFLVNTETSRYRRGIVLSAPKPTALAYSIGKTELRQI